MAKIKTSDNELQDVLTENWSLDSRVSLPYKGSAVMKALQGILSSHENKKIGVWKWSTSPDSSNYYHLWGFSSESNYTKYIGDPTTNSNLLLVDEVLPISTVQGDSYGSYLFSKVSGTNDIVVSDEKLVIQMRFNAVRTSNGDRLNMGIPAVIVIQRSTDGGNTWINIETRSSAIPSTDYSDEKTFTSIDITSCLANGLQKIRMMAQFSYTAEDGSTKTATSTFVPIGNSVTKTKLSLTCQLNWQTPIYASAYQAKGFPVSYMVYGSVVKTLHLLITGGSNTTMPEITYQLSASDDSATVTKNILDTADTYKLFKHGVRTVKAWLTCDNGIGGTLTSEILENRFMVVNPSSEGVDKTIPYLLLQNVLSKADNYTQTDICQYSVFSPSIDENGSIVNSGDSVPVLFYLTDYAENFPEDKPAEYFKIENSVYPGSVNTLNTTIEIESSDESAVLLSAYFRVYRRDSGGNEINFLEESQNTNNIVISVDNSESYAPKSGADFLINPKTRNNTEQNPAQILNARNNNSVIVSEWTGFGFVNDGWITSEFDKQKILRIPSGAKLNFKYNPFAQFLTTADSSMTLELDFAVRNVTNEDDPVIALFESIVTSATGGNITLFRGLRMKPMSGNIFTKSNTVDSETDFNWREGVRTHVLINIHNSVSPNKGDVVVPDAGTGLNVTATKISLVRVFINGDCQRELKYSITDTDEFCTAAMSNGGFALGQDGSDLDIYSIRCYQNNALEPSEILNNYISTLPTTEQKNAKRNRNDILSSGKVDITKVQNLGIRTIVQHGNIPYHESTSKQKGWYEIKQFDLKGNYLPEYSGTICKETKSLVFSRQGSTANTYFWSNEQTKCGDVTEKIKVKISDFHSTITVSDPRDVSIQGNDGTTIQKKVVGIYGGNLGKYDPVSDLAVDYDYEDGFVLVPDGWIDGNGKYRGMGYMVAADTPLASKLVNKINYASSMQSHLTGANNLYNELHKLIVGKNSLQEACQTARVSKYTEPFLYFTQEDGQSSPVYNGPCTFGAGKMDKPTWGYVKKMHPMFAMFEGSDNNYDLTDMRVPFTWNEPDCSENITYKGGDYEGFFYNGKQCLDFDAGSTQSDEQATPIEEVIKVLQGAWNFLYLHSPMITYYKGTFNAFQTSDYAQDVYKKYWCTDGDDAYKLKRYDFVDAKWVDAGLWDSTSKKWGVIDMRTDSVTKATYDASSNQSQYAALNTELKSAIVNHCKKYFGFYFRSDSVKLFYTFIIHFLAGTDNCSKNTYYTIDPKPVDVTIDSETRSCYLFEMDTDDVDTLLPTDNNGRATKPYYIDRMHPYVDGDNSTTKYEGMNNVLFNLCEAMWEGTKELQSMMKRIFSAMEGLVKESDFIYGWNSGSKTSVWGCLYKYIYYVHHYIPEVAYNEAARIRYEYPEMIGFVSSGSGARGVKPITQSNGSLLQCELQFMIRRLVLMASYAAWGPFFDGKTGSIGIAEATDSFSMQAYHLPDSSTSNNNYTFKIVPHQYIYPIGMMGQTNIDPHVRVSPGQSFSLNLGDTTSNDTGMSILGINYYRSIGNIGDLSTTPSNTLTFKGNRLVEIVSEPSKYYVDSDTGKNTPAFRPGGIVISARNIKKLSFKGLSSTSGSINLSSLIRLESIDLRQTSFSDVAIPETDVIKSVQLPATVIGVNISNQKSISLLSLEGYSNLKKFIIKNNDIIDTFPHALGIYKAKPSGLDEVYLENVKWNTEGEKSSADMLMYFANLKSVLIGIIYMVTASSDRYITLQEKLKLATLYGNIDSQSNSLYISYDVRALNKISISGQTFMTNVGTDYQFKAVPSPASGNNVSIKDGKLDIKWELASTASPYSHWTDDNNGLLHVDALSDASLDLKHEMTVSVGLTSGTSLSASKKVGFYRHIPKVEDFAYADGTYDSDYDTTREVIGQVFMRTPLYGTDGTTLIGYNVRVYSVEDLKLVTTDQASTYTTLRFGLYPDNNNGHLSAEQAIKDATGLTSVFDIPTIVNITSRWNGGNPSDGGTVNGINYDCVDDGSYLDANRDDGYKVLPAIGAAASDYSGKEKTELIIEHAKKIIGDYLGKSWPTSSQELVDAMQAIISENSTATSPWRYEEFYYPAVFGCYLYQPKTEGVLADQYKSTKWYCPAEGELARLYNFFRLGVDIANAKTDAANEATTPIMANANAKVGGVLFNFTKNWYWSVSEYNASYSWILNFSSGYLNSNSKSYSNYVRPCTAFDFLL